MKDRLEFEKVKELIQEYLDYELNENSSSLGRCIWDINFYDKFPEDMTESRTDWEDLREMLSSAHYAVIELIEIIEEIRNKRSK